MEQQRAIADIFYEAAVIPELWPAACDTLAAATDADDAAIFAIDDIGTHRFVCSPHMRESIEAFINDPRRLQNIRPMRAAQMAPGIFLRDIEILTPEEFQNDVILHEILHPAGLHFDIGCVFQEPSGHIIMFDLHRKIGRDHFSDENIAFLNAAKPDLARSVYLASRLAFSRAQSVTNTLSMLGLPAAVIGANQKILAVNEQMEALSPRIRSGAGDTLRVENVRTRHLLSTALRAVSMGMSSGVQSIPMMARQVGESPLILHLLPVRRAAQDIFARAFAILVVTTVGSVGPPDMRVLCGLFDLTPAEAKVARGLAAGQTIEDLARSLVLSAETVRTHLKRVMAKTGTRRQTELVILLLGLSLPSGDTDG